MSEFEKYTAESFKEKRDTRRSIALVLSVFVHAALFAILFFSPKYDALKNLRDMKKSEVSLLTPEELQKALMPPPDPQQPLGQIVEQDKRQLNDEKTDTKFLSAHNQKVVQETQAAVHGRFKNTDGSSGERTVEKHVGKVEPKNGLESDKTQKLTQKAEAEEKPHEILTADDGIDAGPKKKKPSLKDLTPSFKLAPPVDSDSVAQGGGDGPSATDDHFKDVKTGMQTLLSTREFVYYSYYQRIKSKLSQYWEPKIKEKMEKIVRQGRSIASTDRRTSIVIVLDRDGVLKRVQIIGASGVNDLDEAAVEAFRAAAPFPNPPKGIVDSDGTIKIHWDFILEA